MTKEQAELISKLCSMRHDFHCNMDKIAKGGEDYTSSWSRLDEDFHAHYNECTNDLIGFTAPAEDRIYQIIEYKVKD